MPINKSELFRRLKILGGELNNQHEQYDLIAVGGTALNLHNIKYETYDVDFIAETGDRNILKKTYHDLFGKDEQIDVSSSGHCFGVEMPSNYSSLCRSVGMFDSIKLRALSVEDVIITKASRLIDRDKDDIKACKNHITKDSLEKRFGEYDYLEWHQILKMREVFENMLEW